MEFFVKHKLTIIGVFGGAIAGYFYYSFYGCENGCTITSSPVNSTLYGSLMGALFMNIFKK